MLWASRSVRSFFLRGAIIIISFLFLASCRDDQSPAPPNAESGGAPEGSAGPQISGSGGRGGAGAVGAGGGGSVDTGRGGNGGGSNEPFAPGPCADIFSDDRLTTYEVTIAPADWDAIVNDFYGMQQNSAAMRDIHPWHPLAEFRYGDEVIHNAMIRLKGYSSWSQAISDANPKMQFVISFNEIDDSARFHGVRKVELDMPRIDFTYLRQRIALQFFRALGVPAQCANSGRLFINGAFYGLYTNMERPDKEFLRRVYPGSDRGDLWDGGWALQTNEDTMPLPHPRLDAFWAAKDTPSIAAIADMDEALLEWAGEAMIADADGYWLGHWNFFLYDHPRKGWLWIPHDLEAVINWTDPRIDPLYYWGGNSGWAPPWQHYLAVIQDDVWRERFVAALRRAHDVWASGGFATMLDRFEDQIRDAAQADPTRPFTFQDHLNEVAYLRQSIGVRDDSVRAWLDCRAAPADALDADGDQRPFCMDCNDADPATYPGAVEICGDARDQSCDGSDFNSCQ